MPNCNLMSWVTLTVLYTQVITTDIDVLVNYCSIVSCSVLIVLIVTEVFLWSASWLSVNNFWTICVYMSICVKIIYADSTVPTQCGSTASLPASFQYNEILLKDFPHKFIWKSAVLKFSAGTGL